MSSHRVSRNIVRCSMHFRPIASFQTLSAAACTPHAAAGAVSLIACLAVAAARVLPWVPPWVVNVSPWHPGVVAAVIAAWRSPTVSNPRPNSVLEAEPTHLPRPPTQANQPNHYHDKRLEPHVRPAWASPRSARGNGFAFERTVQMATGLIIGLHHDGSDL